ncbi:unnamed protein product [Gongylonema pulchrum]|uniref:Myosin_tail_1 domain-containing protein n=1 Tax=Gongylonema pulchrum TaxID=637853 RepID=A0A183D2Z5_9BILA|nr:unnamed protein product [Gongylonema pulchrum]
MTFLQIESNRKREAELQKLRKLLEESQLESEDAMNVLRKKHQDACLDYTEQIEQLQKKNSKIDRERQRLQHEVIELTATIDQLQKDKVPLFISRPVQNHVFPHIAEMDSSCKSGEG